MLDPPSSHGRSATLECAELIPCSGSLTHGSAELDNRELTGGCDARLGETSKVVVDGEEGGARQCTPGEHGPRDECGMRMKALFGE